MLVNCSKEYKNVIIQLFKIYIIRAIPFILLVRKWDYKTFAIIIEDIKKALKLK